MSRPWVSTTMSHMRILLEGIGGIGGVMAARMIRAGHEPTLITGNPGITEAINSTGIKAITPRESFTVPARALTSLDDLTGERFDVALLVMKAGQALEAAEKTLPLLEPETGYIVTLQNGIVEDAVAKIVGEQRVVSGIVGWGGTFVKPGVYEKTGPGEIHIGELNGRVTDRIRALATLLEATCPIIVTDNIRGVLWSKLGINCTITTMGALTGDTLGRMLKDRQVRDAFLNIYREVVDTAESLGVKLERIAANPKLLYLPKNAGVWKRFVKDMITRIVGHKYGGLKSSSLQSLERGRKTEIDYLNGYVVEKAKETGVEAPLNATIVRVIKEIEAGSRQIGPQNMTDLLAVMGTA
ncbi:MAG: 2-dehydropantoate 2-reductase [Deltaproteobacteria bacterium]|nr:2-dehydropantoate 2-reductase [Deltaproteobacteria bacterium]